MDEARLILPEIEMCSDVYNMVHDCDALMVMTEWNEFK
jgi:UDP-glucose 6-dehydrogenase